MCKMCPVVRERGPPGRERIEFAVVALLIYEIADVGISGRRCIRKISNVEPDFA